MRTAVIERNGVLHYALMGYESLSCGRRWYVFCDPSHRQRTIYFDDDVQEDLPTCVRCLGEEVLRGKALEPIELD